MASESARTLSSIAPLQSAVEAHATAINVTDGGSGYTAAPT